MACLKNYMVDPILIEGCGNSCSVRERASVAMSCNKKENAESICWQKTEVYSYRTCLEASQTLSRSHFCVFFFSEIWRNFYFKALYQSGFFREREPMIH